ncbi:MAG: PAS domain-containing sensor histidine kinase [Pseudomonadota bacterium]|nr:PAS domain-containing sensor histidine kinase [Pseudomonadota bacterium]MDE3036912.1 PAS domain-containing sensor histidine kinase [Pseudomonadota bacterium]
MTGDGWQKLDARWQASAIRTFLISVIRHLSPVTWLTLAAFLSATITYGMLAGSNAPLSLVSGRVLTLFIVDAALLLALIGVIGARILRLWASLRAGSAGSRLQKRILVMFSLVTIVPTVIVSVFSALFFNLGIENWFNEQVQTVVRESLAVAEAYLAEHKENIRGDAIAMAGDLNQMASLAYTDPAEFNRIVETQSELRLLTEAAVFQGNRIIAQGRLSFALAFVHIPQDAMERADKGDVVIMTAEEDKVRALIKLKALPDTYLLVGRLIDNRVLNHMENAQGAVKEYDSLKNRLEWLQITFSIVFVASALLLLLAAIWYGMIFAARLTTPISRLVGAAERVRGGDFSARVEGDGGRDEMGMLSRAFNRMTEQLQAQRGELIDANRRIDERRRFSEAVLSGVSAGVIALDRDKNITLFNRSAGAILSKIDQPVTAGKPIDDLLPGIREVLAQAEETPGGEAAQGTLTLNKNSKTITLHVRAGAEHLGSEIEGFIVTFDDITLLVAAQRGAAWSDVARRVAHEIKNPLTPITLAADRLRRKYLKYIHDDEENYLKYIDTITRHVGDIGKMVEEFVSFARMPAPKFVSEDIGGIIRKAVFSAQMTHPAIDYKLELPTQPIVMECDERQIMQVIINLLKNSAESIESSLSLREKASPEAAGIRHAEVASAAQAGEGGVTDDALTSLPKGEGKIIVRLACENNAVTVSVEDNGGGFPDGDIQHMLHPYVTTRTKGTGLGLAIVKKIVEDHKGRITLENISGSGAKVTLSFLQHCDI